MLASFFLHWITFIPSFIFRTEKFYDILGTLAYLTVLSIASFLTYSNSDGYLSRRSLIVVSLVLIWALRLGIFLFIRVLKAGEDRRFRDAKQSFSKFLLWWTVSALWVFFTTLNALTIIINNYEPISDIFFIIGIIIWLIGFSFELISDEQKRRFKLNPSNRNKFISTGLWSVSRHPNYFGEIVIWIGIAVISIPTLHGLQYFTLVSPIFVILLLTRVSGVNLLEKQSDDKWGDLEDYKRYIKKTPSLIPFTKSLNGK
jgi:steroid 5-alpha reductase family enzyme|tara:strand:- start:951 stop:1724 length:774 start_codon:yes stop_codon:yes gene_type:complete